MFKLGTRSKTNLLSAHPLWTDIIELALSYDIIDMGVPDKAGRTIEDQKKLYAKGRTEPGPKVTWTLNSNHLIDPITGYGHAVDIVPYVNGKYSWHITHCLIMATTIIRAAAELNVEIEWGYHLWKKDMPHFQLKER